MSVFIINILTFIQIAKILPSVRISFFLSIVSSPNTKFLLNDFEQPRCILLHCSHKEPNVRPWCFPHQSSMKVFLRQRHSSGNLEPAVKIEIYYIINTPQPTSLFGQNRMIFSSFVFFHFMEMDLFYERWKEFNCVRWAGI